MAIRMYCGQVSIITLVFIIVGYNAGATSNLNEFYGNLIKANLNASANPCEDFYGFACGNWYLQHNATEYIDMPGYMDYKVNQQLGDIMDNLEQISWSTDVYGKFKDLYDVCNNVAKFVLNPFLVYVHKELEMVWPIFALDDEDVVGGGGEWKNATNFDWLRTIAVLRQYGFNGLFLNHNVNVIPRNSSEFILQISQHYASSSLDAQDVVDIFRNFGLTSYEGQQLTKELIQFEETLTTLVKYDFANETEQKNYADNYEVYTLKKLSEKVPEINWQQYFQIVLNTTENLQNLSIQTFALQTEFFTNLNTLLKETSNETLAYYIMLKFMYFINDQMPSTENRNCIKYMRGFLPVFMNYIYEESIFKTKRLEIERHINGMFENLKESFTQIVAENHLKLNENERNFILKELQTMQLKIGNLPRNCSEEFVNAHYKTLKVNRKSFVESHFSVLRFKNQLEYEKLHEGNQTIEEKFYNLDTDSLSSSSPVKIFDNAILIPHGYLQMPLFDTNLGDLHQYSLFGVILAHEIIHAYDLFHIIFDYKGNYDYVGSQIGHHYYPHLDCYSQSASDIISENIADVSGLRIAYQFYQTLPPDTSIKFDFLNLTKQQYFFVNSVQFLCADMEKISNLTLESENLGHDMHDKRVRQNWSKFEEFALAFNCLQTREVNKTEESCRIW